MIFRKIWATTASILHALALARRTNAEIVHHVFNLTWVWTAPDNNVSRPVIGVNNSFPLPLITATIGDTIEIDVINSLGNQSASIHFHGLFMNGSSHMDGTSYVSQCAIEPTSDFKYSFKVQQAGTYWYHSHTKSQYPDGLRGMLIIHDPDSPFKDRYDEEIVLSLSDWYHEQTPSLLSTYGSGGHMIPYDPTPNAGLVNDTHSLDVPVKKGRTYFLRLANIGALASHYFWIEGHTMTVVEVDGVYTEPSETQTLYIGTGQRYGVLISTLMASDRNFPMVARLDRGDIETYVCLKYDSTKPCPAAEVVEDPAPFDDMRLVPLDQEPRLTKVDRTIPLSIGSMSHDGLIHWTFNSKDYAPPEVPTLFEALTDHDNASDPIHYGIRSLPFVVQRNEVIEILLTNMHMQHPVHLHGHNFQVLRQAAKDENDENAPAVPLRRDTMLIKSHEMLSLRFRADNPGVWLFHCHMEWHAHSGLSATLIEAPLDLQHRLILTGHETLDPNKTCSGSVSQISEPTMPSLTTPVSNESASEPGEDVDIHAPTTETVTIQLRFSAYDVVILAIAVICLVMGVVITIWLKGGFSLQKGGKYGYRPLVSD